MEHAGYAEGKEKRSSRFEREHSSSKLCALRVLGGSFAASLSEQHLALNPRDNRIEVMLAF